MISAPLRHGPQAKPQSPGSPCDCCRPATGSTRKIGERSTGGAAAAATAPVRPSKQALIASATSSGLRRGGWWPASSTSSNHASAHRAAQRTGGPDRDQRVERVGQHERRRSDRRQAGHQVIEPVHERPLLGEERAPVRTMLVPGVGPDGPVDELGRFQRSSPTGARSATRRARAKRGVSDHAASGHTVPATGAASNRSHPLMQPGPTLATSTSASTRSGASCRGGERDAASVGVTDDDRPLDLRGIELGQQAPSVRREVASRARVGPVAGTIDHQWDEVVGKPPARPVPSQMPIPADRGGTRCAATTWFEGRRSARGTRTPRQRRASNSPCTAMNTASGSAAHVRQPSARECRSDVVAMP